jgi:hypothetical protein
MKLIEEAFSDLPLAAPGDPGVRGEFKIGRGSFSETPRKADHARTSLARIMSFAKDPWHHRPQGARTGGLTRASWVQLDQRHFELYWLPSGGRAR